MQPTFPRRRKAGSPSALLAVLTVWLVSASALWSSSATIEKIEVRGLRRMTSDAFVFASGLKAGQPYDEEEVRRAFRRLWDRGLFSDLKADVEDGTTGKVIVFTAAERAIIVSIDYDEVKAITKTNIEDRFKERKLELSVGKPLDRRLIHRAEETIRDLLGEKGYLDATVHAEVRSPTDSTRSVKFSIRQGPRTRIKKIEFVGNSTFSDRKLRKTMKLTKEYSWLTAMSGKAVYYPLKYDQDIEKIRDLYQNDGYLDVDIKPPQVKIQAADKKAGEAAAPEPETQPVPAVEDAAPGAASGTAPGPVGLPVPPPEPGAPAAQPPEPGAPAAQPPEQEPPPPAPPPDETEKQRKRREKQEDKARKQSEKKEEKAGRGWVYLTVRVNEGPQYRTGEIQSTGNTVFTDGEILRRIPLRRGDVLSRGLLDLGVEALRSAYGEKGYIYANIGRNVEKKEGNVANVTIDIREDRPFRVDRIEFEGNTATRDEVLRREVRLSEGDLLNRRRLDVSVYKLNQLGYISPVEDPIIEPIPGTDRARIRIRTEEKGRNEIQIGGGYSGQEGFFFAGSFATRNFLGRGENLGLSAQIGGSSSRYTLSFTEPWFLGKPVVLGFSIFRRDLQFAQQSTQSGTGGSIVLGRRIGDFWSLQGTYSFETIKFTDRSENFLTGREIDTVTDTQVGAITPSIVYNTVNNPLRPTRGRSIALSATLAGNYLGGENDFYKPIAVGIQFIPISKRTFLGLHVGVGGVSPYGNSPGLEGEILNLPRFERFFIGGDIGGPRVFETRTISPIRFVSRDGGAIAENRSDISTVTGRNVFGKKVRSCPEFDFTLDTISSPTNGTQKGYFICNPSQQLIGGNRYLLTQLEYDISVGGPFVFGVFLDAGTVLAEDQGWGFYGARVSAGVETRIYLPVFGAPLRFIWGVPIHKEPYDSTSSFTFSIGTSF